MPLAAINPDRAASAPSASPAGAAAASSPSTAYGLGSSSAQRGYAARGGESALFSRKVLLPLGLTVASAVGIYYLYKCRQDKKDRSDAEDMFKANANNTATSGKNAQKRSNAHSNGSAPSAEVDQRKKALDDLMRILGGVEDGVDGLLDDGEHDGDEHPFVRAQRLMAERRMQRNSVGKGKKGGKKQQRHAQSGVEELSDDDDEEEVKVEEEVDEEAYISRFFDYAPMPEGFAAARGYCLAAVEAALAVLEGRKPRSKANKKGGDEDSEFEDEESNPDPILQVATQIEVDLRHRLAYFAQEFGFQYFRDGEEASGICATYAGPIPPLANMPKGGLSKKVLLEAVKEYLEVCAEIDRTKPIVVDMAKQEAVTGGRDKDAWRAMANRTRDVEAADEDGFGKKGGAKKKKSYMDKFDDDSEDEQQQQQGAAAKGPKGPTSANASKEAAIGRMLAAREQRFMGQHAAEQMDRLMQEKQMKLMQMGDAMSKRAMLAGGDDDGDDYEDEVSEFEDDGLEGDLAYIGEPLHDTNRRAFEAALIRAVLLQISSEEEPMTKAHMPVLDTIAALYKEPSEVDEEEEEGEEDYDDEDEEDGWGDDDDDYDDLMFGGMGGMMMGMDDQFAGPMGMGGGMGRMMDLMSRGRGRGGMLGMMGPGGDDDEFDDAIYDDDDDYDDMYDDDEYADDDEAAAYEQAMFERMMQMQAARLRGGVAGRGNTNKAADANKKLKAATKKAEAISRANINMMLGEADAADRRAMFMDDDDDDDEGMPGLDDGKSNPDAREAFIRDMIAREAAEYEAMRAAGGSSRKSRKSSKKGAAAHDEDEDDWVDY